MKANMSFVLPILKYRFTPIGWWLELRFNDALGAYYYGGDRVDWEKHRRKAYLMYRKGASVKEMCKEHSVDEGIVEWWISIWSLYDKAWNPKKYGEAK